MKGQAFTVSCAEPKNAASRCGVNASKSSLAVIVVLSETVSIPGTFVFRQVQSAGWGDCQDGSIRGGRRCLHSSPNPRGSKPAALDPSWSTNMPDARVRPRAELASRTCAPPADGRNPAKPRFAAYSWPALPKTLSTPPVGRCGL